MQVENNLTLLSSILTSGRYILFASDGVWGLSCNALDDKAVHELIKKSHETSKYIAEFLVSDLEMLKKYTNNLHPRIETLLVYHERPLRLKCEAKVILKKGLSSKEEFFFRIVKEEACQTLINEVNHPLFSVSFLSNDGVNQLSKDEIKVELFKNVDFIASGVANDISFVPLVKVDFDKDGIIDIL